MKASKDFLAIRTTEALHNLVLLIPASNFSFFIIRYIQCGVDEVWLAETNALIAIPSEMSQNISRTFASRRS
jgi:hypothetical protein